MMGVEGKREGEREREREREELKNTDCKSQSTEGLASNKDRIPPLLKQKDEGKFSDGQGGTWGFIPFGVF